MESNESCSETDTSQFIDQGVYKNHQDSENLYGLKLRQKSHPLVESLNLANLKISLKSQGNGANSAYMSNIL